jgi:peptidoglycan hydrolase-like protein with peptidoglycan-binding domain
MKTRDALRWFQTAFDSELRSAVAGTPFDIDLLSALAYHETGYLWQTLLAAGLKKNEVLALCVGDTIDGGVRRGRRAFPRDKTQLLGHPKGKAMFTIARAALVRVARHIPGYAAAAAHPDKFCRGFGIFQRDLQFFPSDPAFFLETQWSDAEACFGRVMDELKQAMVRQGWSSKTILSDEEKLFVAIAYNRGRADLSRGLKQGHRNADGKYYGELVAAYYDLARSIPGAVGGAGRALSGARISPFVPLAKAPPKYPGRLLLRDSPQKAAVRRIQQRLRDLGYTQPGKKGGVEPLTVDGLFGRNTEAAVELFQARHTDVDGNPLILDGLVGADTWAALFGPKSVPGSDARAGAPAFFSEVLEIASLEVGTLEEPAGSNRGRRVEQYQRSVGLGRGNPWCVAFVYWCFEAAAQKQGIPNPMEKECRTGGVLDLWTRACGARKVNIVRMTEAFNDPAKVKPGMIFVISTGGGLGHAGLVSRVLGNRLETIEGNTNGGGSREGIGVFHRSGRTLQSINRGFIEFVV